MRCDTDRLAAYADGALTAAEQAALTEHLAGCPACRAALADHQAQSQAVAASLSALDPISTPSPAQALARFRTETQPARALWGSRGSLWGSLRRNIAMTHQPAYMPPHRNGMWRPLAVGAAAVICLALLFSFAPVRQVAADFLGLFRVRKFAVIPLDQQQTDRLEALLQQTDTGVLGEPQFTREEGPEQAVGDATQATSLAGYGVRTPSKLSGNAVLEKFTVQAGPAMHYEIDRTTLEAVLRAAGARIDGLPQTDKLTFDVDIASITRQQYWLGLNRLELMQVPSPEVDLPEGIDPVTLAETAFLFLGMPAEDAGRMAASIDWTSTLVIPLPAQAAQAREVSVDGVTGLLIESVDNARKNSALLWERNGILYFLSGTNVDQKLLLDVADSLQ